MATITIYINGQEVQAEEGTSVLQAAEAAGLYIPTLCHHPALKDFGACRICLVEVEPRGQLHPACTFPVSPGLRLQTDSEKVRKARRFVLELLFSERNHYCMYCAASGECDLQRLAYENGMDHWTYVRPHRGLPVATSRQYFIMDHNRCILCRRCIRACDEVSAVHTLAVGKRGTHSMIVADLNAPFGDSTCISCGTCLQVCPTGALLDRKSSYMGTNEKLDETDSVCFGCNIGCGIVARTRNNRLLRVEGDWDAEPNAGLLCRMGRFDPVYVTAPRVNAPLRRVNGKLLPCSWDEALQLANAKLSTSDALALVSSRATNEEMAAAVGAFGKGKVALFDSVAVLPAPGQAATLADITKAKAIVALAADLAEEHVVAACLARRAVDNGAKLYLLGGNTTGLAGIAALTGITAEAAAVATKLANSQDVVVLYGPEATAADLKAFTANARFLGLPAGTNTAAAQAQGIGQTTRQSVDALYVYAADDDQAAMPTVKAKFVVVHSCYRTPLTEAADLVLPAMHWTEKDGHLTNVEGKALTVSHSVAMAAALREDGKVMAALAGKCGQKATL